MKMYSQNPVVRTLQRHVDVVVFPQQELTSVFPSNDSLFSDGAFSGRHLKSMNATGKNKNHQQIVSASSSAG